MVLKCFGRLSAGRPIAVYLGSAVEVGVLEEEHKIYTSLFLVMDDLRVQGLSW